MEFTCKISEIKIIYLVKLVKSVRGAFLDGGG